MAYSGSLASGRAAGASLMGAEPAAACAILAVSAIGPWWGRAVQGGQGRPTLTPIVTSGGDGRNFGEQKCSPLLMKVTTFVLAACTKALRRVVVSFDVRGYV